MVEEQLGVVEFGRRLLETEDLDPLYVALWKAEMSKAQLCRWLVAYWCYYHAGLCCQLSEVTVGFWAAMHRVAKGGKEYPRGTERRHFRGKLAIESVGRLRDRFSMASELVSWLGEGGPTAYGVCARVLSFYGFGEWIKWKVPDMLDRLGLAEVKFVEKDLQLMFSTSRDGAKETCEVCGGGEQVERKSLRTAHRYLLQHLGKFKAPPLYDRPINVQETETIFCKWHSHRTGRYPVGKDCRDLREGLLRYRGVPTARRVLAGLPKFDSKGQDG